MTGHLGTRVSALLDGQMPAAEAERAWAHVHQCHSCRDLVEREGWVKTRLAGLSFGSSAAPDQLKGSLLGMPPGDVLASINAAMPPTAVARNRRNVSLAAVGGGAVGAAVMGVLAFGAAPADAPSVPMPPASQIQVPSPSLSPGPVLTPDARP